MSEPIHDLTDELIARIRTSLETAGCLTPSVLAYVESALFPAERDRLAAFLTDDSDCERDSLLDLIFSPDASVQIGLEPLLERARYSVDDQRAIHDRLMDMTIETRITMPDGRALVDIRLPDYIKAQYLRRLCLSWQLDDPVAAAVEAGVSSTRRSAVRVRLRNAGIRPAAGRQVFLCRFFERIPDSDPEYLACLDLVLSLLESVDGSADGYDMLVGHKRSLFRRLQQIRRFEALLQRSNVETLMLQGVRVPHGSCEALWERMRLIDRICFGIYGKTEAMALPVDQPLYEVVDPDVPEAVIQSLLR